jgi:nicotinamide riboside kinase
MRIGFSGVPSTGKTSMARALGARLPKAEVCGEYARRYINTYGQIESVLEQYRILQKQIQWENAQAADYIITDSPIFLGFLYCLNLRDSNRLKDVLWVNDVFKQLSKLNCPPRYDYIFHLSYNKISITDDTIRHPLHLDTEWRQKADLRLRFIYDLFPPRNFVELESVTIDDRVTECLEKIL